MPDRPDSSSTACMAALALLAVIAAALLCGAPAAARAQSEKLLVAGVHRQLRVVNVTVTGRSNLPERAAVKDKQAAALNDAVKLALRAARDYLEKTLERRNLGLDYSFLGPDADTAVFILRETFLPEEGRTPYRVRITAEVAYVAKRTDTPQPAAPRDPDAFLLRQPDQPSQNSLQDFDFDAAKNRLQRRLYDKWHSGQALPSPQTPTAPTVPAPKTPSQ